jgi:hypothetical protein
MSKQPRVSDDAQSLIERIKELEMQADMSRLYANKQQEKINDLMAQLREHETFMHAIQLNYQILKDHRQVQELIDRACAWSIADRDFRGELSVIDRQAAVEMARRRLAESL